jgi:small nuclear ribonucleoprotein E
LSVCPFTIHKGGQSRVLTPPGLAFLRPDLSPLNYQLTTMSRQRKSNKMIKQPIQIIFGNLQSKKRVSVALYESDNTIEGIIIGFDEYMNLVLDEVTTHESSGTVTSLGRILLKGENITWIADAA